MAGVDRGPVTNDQYRVWIRGYWTSVRRRPLGHGDVILPRTEVTVLRYGRYVYKPISRDYIAFQARTSTSSGSRGESDDGGMRVRPIMLKAIYLTLGVVVARWIFQRRLEGDTLSRLRQVGGL